jgi:hypothetical protein
MVLPKNAVHFHVVSMIFGQLTRALSLNDICDTLRHHSEVLLSLLRAAPPSRNGLSHANKVRNSAMAKDKPSTTFRVISLVLKI